MTQWACNVKVAAHLRVVQGIGLELVRLSNTKLINVHEDIQYL